MPNRSITLVRLALLSAPLATMSACGPDPATPDPGYETIRVDSFDLIDAEGAPADETILNGHYTVLDFIFTNCPIYCPSMAVVMQRVQDATAGSDARLLSISADGEHDTPEVLDAYADAIDADRSRWSFLTGDPGAVHALCEEQLLLGISVDSSRQVAVRDGSEMDFIDHPTRLILVGPDRQVLGMYSYQDPGAIDALIARLRALTD